MLASHVIPRGQPPATHRLLRRCRCRRPNVNHRDARPRLAASSDWPVSPVERLHQGPPASSSTLQGAELTALLKSLVAFLEETNLTEQNIEAKDPATALTLEQVLDEKRLYDLSLKLEKINVDEEDAEFTEPCV